MKIVISHQEVRTPSISGISSHCRTCNSIYHVPSNSFCVSSAWCNTLPFIVRFRVFLSNYSIVSDSKQSSRSCSSHLTSTHHDTILAYLSVVQKFKNFNLMQFCLLCISVASIYGIRTVSEIFVQFVFINLLEIV